MKLNWTIFKNLNILRCGVVFTPIINGYFKINNQPAFMIQLYSLIISNTSSFLIIYSIFISINPIRSINSNVIPCYFEKINSSKPFILFLYYLIWNYFTLINISPNLLLFIYNIQFFSLIFVYVFPHTISFKPRPYTFINWSFHYS